MKVRKHETSINPDNMALDHTTIPVNYKAASVMPPVATELETPQITVTPPRAESRRWVPLAFAAVYILWGSTYLGIRIAIESMPPLANVTYVHDVDGNWLYMIGRLKPGVSRPQLQAKLSGLLRQELATGRTYASDNDKPALARAHIVLTPGGAGIQGLQDQYTSHLQLLMWASGLVLLIACANIANLLLARGMGRKSEM